MRLSRIICLMLFLLCLSVSLATMLSFEFAIVYGVVAMVVSFVFLWKSTLKCPLLHGEYCFRLLNDVIKVFALAAVVVCVLAIVYALVLIYFTNANAETTFGMALDYSQVICLPFFFMVMEAASIVAIKDTNACLEMQWIS